MVEYSYKTAYPDFSSGPIYKHIIDLDNPKIVGGEQVVRLKGTRIMVANYALLQHDFPQLRDDHLKLENPELVDLSESDFINAKRKIIDEWLIRNTAFISKAQAAQTIVNTKIKTSKETKVAYRPPHYGRALVFPMDKPKIIPESMKTYEEYGAWGLIDAKGVGVGLGITPEMSMYKHGLMSIDYALREYLMERVVHHIFSYNKTEYTVVPTYAILVPTFKMRSDKGLLPTAIILRRAQRREKDGSDLPVYGSVAQMVKIEMELLLRKYGVTSATILVEILKKGGKLTVKYNKERMTGFDKDQLALIEKVTGVKPPGKLFRGINIQVAREVGAFPLRAQVMDFGQYNIMRNFTSEILSLTNDKLLRWGGTIKVDEPSYVQPDENICIPFDLWLGEEDKEGKKKKQTKSEDFKGFCLRIGKAFAKNKEEKLNVRNAIEDYVYTMVSKWSK